MASRGYIEIETPDGIVEFPKGTSRDVMESALRAKYPSDQNQGKEQPSAPTPITDAIGSAKDAIIKEAPNWFQRGIKVVKEEGPPMLTRLVPPIIGQSEGQLWGGPIGGIIGGGIGGGMGEYLAEKGEVEKGQRPKVSWPQVALQTGISAIPPLAIAKSISLPLRVGLRGLEGAILGAGGAAASQAVEGQRPTLASVGPSGLLGLGMGGIGGGISEALRPIPEISLPGKEEALKAQQLFAKEGIKAPLTPGESTMGNFPQTVEEFLKKTYGGSGSMEKIGQRQYGAGTEIAKIIQEKAGGIPTEDFANSVKGAYERFNQLDTGGVFNPTAYGNGLKEQLALASRREKSSPIAANILKDLNAEFKAKKGALTITELNDIRKELGDNITAARKAKEGNSSKLLINLKKSIDSDFNDVERGLHKTINPEAAIAIKGANELNKQYQGMTYIHDVLHGGIAKDFDIVGGSVAHPQSNRFYKRVIGRNEAERIKLRNKRIEVIGKEGNDLAEALAHYMPSASNAYNSISGKKFNTEAKNILTAPIKTTLAGMVSSIYTRPTVMKQITKSYNKGIGVSNRVLDALYRQTLLRLVEETPDHSETTNKKQ